MCAANRLAAPGADDRDRTGDLVLTKDVLYLLSYISLMVQMGRLELPPGVVTRHGPEPCASANSATSAWIPCEGAGAPSQGSLVSEAGLEPARLPIRPSNVRVCQFRHSDRMKLLATFDLKAPW